MEQSLLPGRTEPAYCRQFIAITPRSGSMWWCDLLSRVGLGRPFEFLNESQNFRKQHPTLPQATKWSDIHAALAAAAHDKAYDLKTSWFQFEFLLIPTLKNTLQDQGFPCTVWSYLTREDLVAQAMSLYLMRRLGSSHARRGEPVPEISTTWLEPTQANFSGLMCWLLHIVQQEYAWENFFHEFGIKPWRGTYEAIVARPAFFALQYFRHAKSSGMEKAHRVPRSFTAMRRAIRLSPLVKRTYRGPSTERFLAEFRQSYREVLTVFVAHRGKQDALALRKQCGLLTLDESEILSC